MIYWLFLPEECCFNRLGVIIRFRKAHIDPMVSQENSCFVLLNSFFDLSAIPGNLLSCLICNLLLAMQTRRRIDHYTF